MGTHGVFAPCATTLKCAHTYVIIALGAYTFNRVRSIMWKAMASKTVLVQPGSFNKVIRPGEEDGWEILSSLCGKRMQRVSVQMTQ